MGPEAAGSRRKLEVVDSLPVRVLSKKTMEAEEEAPEPPSSARGSEENMQSARHLRLVDRVATKIEQNFDKGKKKMGIDVKVQAREAKKKELKAMSHDIRNDRRKIHRLSDKARLLSDKDLSQVLEMREGRKLKIEENRERRVAKAKALAAQSA